MTESLYQTAPPRVLSVPQTPVPQTCFGVLNELGMPTDIEPIQDIAPELNWMAMCELFVGSFEMDSNKTPGTNLFHMTPTKHYNANPRLSPLGTTGWHHIPFAYSKWWNGVPVIRLMAIKPAHVTGKILIYHSPDITKVTPTADPAARDHYLRGIKMEWDLGLSSEFVFEVPAFNVIPARPTWIPRNIVTPTALASRKCFWNMPIPTYSFGNLIFQVAESLQPGNIYPGSIRILVFSSFRNAQFFVPTDARNGSRALVNVLGLTDVPKIDVQFPENE